MNCDLFHASLIAILTVSCATSASHESRTGYPEDQPIRCTSMQSAEFEVQLQPRIELARSTYPDAKERWQRGLGRGQRFFITTLFFYSEFHYEQVFVFVEKIRDGEVYGRIASDAMGPGFEVWDPYTFPETALRDWTISHPDGTEEGNYVGKFVDQFRGQCPG